MSRDVIFTANAPMPIGDALETISGQLLLVKDENGNIYWPEMGINQIGDMQPREGYQMNLVSAGELTYIVD